MRCGNCGNEMPQGVASCYVCGQPLQSDAQPYMPMKWFKFLIYFGLFFGAFTNFLTGINLITGNIYGSDKELVYSVFENLQTMDMIMGALLIGIAALGVYTRFRLSGFRKDGPAMVQVMYAAGAAFQLIYALSVQAVLPSSAALELDFSSMYSGAITGVIMIFVNRSYFAKRAHLFVN